MEVKYYKTSSGRIPVKEFVEALSRQLQEEFIEAVRLLEQGELISMPTGRPLSNVHRGLNELRLKDRTGAYRIIYFYKSNDGIFMLHAFKKTSQETPQRELKLALRRLKEI